MKLVATDFDGTLAFKSIILKENALAIKNLDDDFKFAIASGRFSSTLKEILAENNIKYDYLVCCNGAFIVDDKDNCLFKKTIPNIDVNQIIEIAKKYNCESYEIVNGYDGSLTLFVDPKDHSYDSDTNIFSIFKYTEKEMLDFGEVVQITISNLNDSKRLKMYEELSKIEDIIISTNGFHFDINAPNISKYNGLKFLDDMEQFEEIYVFGDEANDLEMVEKFTGFAMKSGNEALKKVAYKTIDSVAEGIKIITTK